MMLRVLSAGLRAGWKLALNVGKSFLVFNNQVYALSRNCAPQYVLLGRVRAADLGLAEKSE